MIADYGHRGCPIKKEKNIMPPAGSDQEARSSRNVTNTVTNTGTNTVTNTGINTGTTDGQVGASRPLWGNSERVLGLLVSVRSIQEARIAATAEVDVIDLKEPAAGALGACQPETWQRCTTSVPFRGQWSVALGEARAAIPLAPHVPPQFRFAKAGPAGICQTDQLIDLWQTLAKSLTPTTELVPVAYADFKAADCLSPETIIMAAGEFAANTILLDTFGKTGRSSIEILGQQRLSDLLARCQALKLNLVMAGSLAFDDMPTLAELGVKQVGVRGCVCVGGRNGEIAPPLVKQLIAKMRGSAN